MATNNNNQSSSRSDYRNSQSSTPRQSQRSSSERTSSSRASYDRDYTDRATYDRGSYNNSESPKRNSYDYEYEKSSSSSRNSTERSSRSSDSTARRQQSTTSNNNSNKKGKKPKRKHGKWKIVRNILLILLLVLVFALIGAGIGAYLGIIKNSPKLDALAVKPGTYTSIMVSATTGEEIQRFAGDEDRIYVEYSEISPYLPNAAIAIEDERFRSHNGVDIKGTMRSVYQTIFEDSSQGGSTITQQVIKNHLGYTRNTIVTKLQEQFLAVKFEKDLTEQFGSKDEAKDYILELYLNTIALGHGLNGVQTASNYYFDKDAKDLTLAESCVIVSITQNPSKYMPDLYPEQNYNRAKTTLNYMLELGLVTETEYAQAEKDLSGPVYEEIKNSSKIVSETASNFSYFTDQVVSELVRDFKDLGMSEKEAYDTIYRGGITIYATQDMEIQGIVDEAMLNDDLFNSADYGIEVALSYGVADASGDVSHKQTRKLVKTDEDADKFVDDFVAEQKTQGVEVIVEKVDKIPQPQASFVILENGTGRVLALSGGRGEKTDDLGFNRATQALRQPGSVFKVLSTYAPGIDMQKINASTVFDDVPTATYGDHTFKNWYKGFRGLSTAREGVRDSLNIVTVKAMEFIGVEDSYEYLENFGFTSLEGAQDKNLSTALGGITTGVSNMETTAAMATIQNSGAYIKPIYYTKVYDHDGKMILDNTTPETRQVMSPQAAYIVTDMMYDVVYRGGTGGAAKLPSNMPVAGKTGTTSDSKDLTFVAYTPYMTAGIFMGNDTPKEMRSNKEHIIIWQTIMAKVQEVKKLEVKQFVKPDGIVPASVCKESGELVTDLCALDPRGSTAYTEYFIAGTQPTTPCSVHQEVKIDSTTEKVANPYCPADSVITKVGIVRPIPYTPTSEADTPEDHKYEISTSNTCTVHSATNDGNKTVEPDPTTPVNPGYGVEVGTNGDSGLLPSVTDPNANGNTQNNNSGNGSSGNSSTGNGSTGNGSTGNGSSGNGSSGNGATGNGSSSGGNSNTTPTTPVVPPETVPEYKETFN